MPPVPCLSCLSFSLVLPLFHLQVGTKRLRPSQHGFVMLVPAVHHEWWNGLLPEYKPGESVK